MVYRSDISVCLLVANTFWLLQDGDDEEDDKPVRRGNLFGDDDEE